MKVKTNGDFARFQKYFEKYKSKFGVTGYKTYFKHEPLDTGFASITIDQDNMVATVKLNNNLSYEDGLFHNVKRSAKHEALHLLVGRLECLAGNRYCRHSEIYEATEEIVFKLEELIPDLK